MKLIVCIDENNGMMFNYRRQSRDRILIADLCEQVGSQKLYISAYSEPLFKDIKVNYTVSSSPLLDAEDEAYCFIEDLPLSPLFDRVDEVILYHWNRYYPADVYFDASLDGFTLVDTHEFVGSSHEKITKECWRK